MNSFDVAWRSPSNIALVKYWGKREKQIPENASVSFTLKKAYTELSIKATKKSISDDQIQLDFFFEEKPSQKFKEKIEKFLITQKQRFPWLVNYSFVMNSINTFPHSSGIASSASSMSALCLGILELDEKINDKKYSNDDFYKIASELSRLASGSAGRSVYPFMASWGRFNDVTRETSDLYASPLKKEDVNEIFQDYCDDIVIVDNAEKSVSSRAGHALMDAHPFREVRYKLANENVEKVIEAMKNGDMETFINIVEAEALMLHGLMMTSNPSYILLKPNSLLVIDVIRKIRETTKLPVCFTIDAGPNIHVLYPKKYATEIGQLLKQNLADFKIIHDETGDGPLRLKD